LLPSGGLLECGVPTLVQHKSNESWSHYHPEVVWNPMCQHSHYTKVMNPGIVTIRRKFGMRCANTRTTVHGINRESSGNYQLIGEESTRGRGFHRELPAYLLGFRPVRSKFVENPSYGNNSKISRFKSYILTIPTLKKI
jgi:hypothetical protein